MLLFLTIPYIRQSINRLLKIFLAKIHFLFLQPFSSLQTLRRADVSADPPSLFNRRSNTKAVKLAPTLFSRRSDTKAVKLRRTRSADKSGSSSFGRARPCQGRGGRFEPGLPLSDPATAGFFVGYRQR